MIFMSANLKPFSLMGLPNKITSSEKDLHATTIKHDFFYNHPQNKQETPSLIVISEAERSVVPAPSLEIRVPSGGEDDGGCTTPKAAESEAPKCPPPPPKKPKSLPSTKRKAQRVLLDLSSEIESMFPSSFLVCGKIKKVRTGCP